MGNEVDARQLARDFDSLIDHALREKYDVSYGAGFYAQTLERFPQTRCSVADFLDPLQESDCPAERVPGLVTRLIDLRLQMYYIQEVDLGTYNRDFYEPLTAMGVSPDESPPRLLLRKLSFDQNLIGKSRVLWERVMNFVYYLETGGELEARGRKSKKGAFERWLVESAPEKWRFLEPYGPEVERFDEKYRTPEFHKNSTLRGELFGSSAIDPNDLLLLANRVGVQMWHNLLAVVRDGWVSSYNDLHSLETGVGIDPRYLPPHQRNAAVE